jgi:hypothetical protein
MKFPSSLLAGLLILHTSGALAESRVFILANPPDGNGIDRCLANGEKCGAQAARSNCQSHEFFQAKAYRRVDPDEVTGSVPKTAADGCPNGGCDEYVAIICQR